MYTEITTVEAAFSKMKLDINVKPTIEGLPDRFSTVLDKVYQLIVVSESIREGYVPNYNNSDLKYEPWFDLEEWEKNPSGFRFLDSSYARTSTLSVLGPLLSQETEEKSDFFGKTFESLFREVMKPSNK